MDAVLFILYVGLIALAYWRVRSVGWLALAAATVISVTGVLISFSVDLGLHWTRVQLQIALLAALAAMAVWAFVRGSTRLSPLRRQGLAVWLPFGLVLAAIMVITTLWTAQPAFLNPVSFLMGHAVAEDNAKWLDFTSQFATGLPIWQAVPMGGPLQLFLTFVGTAMGALSSLWLGGYNEVAVAANTVVLGQFFIVALAPFALAPLVDARLRSRGGDAGQRIPVPFIWLAAGVLSVVLLLVTAYGHLTLQFTLLICTLWATVFLSQLRVRRARLLASLIVAGTMTVWLPLNVMAIVILLAWLVILVGRGLRAGRGGWDPIGLGLWLVFTVALWEPLRSSLSYFLTPAAAGPVAGQGGGVSATAALRVSVRTGLDESGLFSSTGGTEQVEPLLAMLAVTAVVAAAILLKPQTVARPGALYRRFAPVGLLGFFSFAIYFLDFWSTGTGPHYGSMKFTFMAAVACLVACAPIALMNFDRQAGARMSPVRWIALAGVVFLLVIDSLIPRAIAAARPEQWSPPIPFNNPASYWWPADVNGTGSQPLSQNPIGCVYLPQGAQVPSALLKSQLSDPQRVYSCTRILAGLAGADFEAQPLVDWLRREWLSNAGAWEPAYDGLAQMPADVLDRPMILLDDGSNVIGLTPLRSLLQKYPRDAGLAAPTS